MRCLRCQCLLKGALGVRPLQSPVCPPLRRPAILSALFNMYARLRSPEKGDALYARVQAHRQGPMTPANYASLLNVYAKAEHPPYGVPRRWAIRAAQVAQEALDAGVVPGLAFMHSLMECQVCAGRTGRSCSRHMEGHACCTAFPGSWVHVCRCGWH